MERMTLILLLVCGANAGFMDRLNDLYARWNSGAAPHAFSQNDRQNLVTADQLLPDALLHQQILGPQLAAAGYSGAQIVAGPIAVPLKNLPRPPGFAYSQQPSPAQPVYQPQSQKQLAPVAPQQNHAAQYQPQQPQQAPVYHTQTQAPARYAPQPLQYKQPQQTPPKPVLKYQPPQQAQHYQHSATHHQPTSPPLQYQAAAGSVQHHAQPVSPQYQAPPVPAQYPSSSYHKVPLSDSSVAAAQQSVAYQQPLTYTHPQPQFQAQPKPVVHHSYVPHAGQQKPVGQQYQQPVGHQYQFQQNSFVQQTPQVYRPNPQPSHQNVALPPPLPVKQPVYQHAQKSKQNDLAYANYQQASSPVAPAAGAQYYPGQVLSAENTGKVTGFDHDAPVKYQNSEWTPIPRQNVESSTTPSHFSDAVLVPSASIVQDQLAASDISDADLQNLNFNHVFDGVVPDIPEIPHGFDFSSLSNSSAFGNFDPALLGLLEKDGNALAHLKDPNAFAHLKGNPHALAALNTRAAASVQVAQIKADNPSEVDKLPAQGRSSEGPVRTSQETVKVSPVVKKLKQKYSAKNDSVKGEPKSELTKVKRKKVVDASGKVVKTTTVSPVTDHAVSDTSSALPPSSDAIITASWKTEKPQAVPRIGEGSGRFVGRVLPAEDSDVAPVKSSAQLSDGIYVSNVGYSIKFTSRR